MLPQSAAPEMLIFLHLAQRREAKQVWPEVDLVKINLESGCIHIPRSLTLKRTSNSSNQYVQSEQNAGTSVQ